MRASMRSMVYPLNRRVADAEGREAAAAQALRGAQQEHESAVGTLTGKARTAADLDRLYAEILPVGLAGARRATYVRLADLARESNLVYGRRVEESKDPGQRQERNEKGRLSKFEISMVLKGQYDGRTAVPARDRDGARVHRHRQHLADGGGRTRIDSGAVARPVHLLPGRTQCPVAASRPSSFRCWPSWWWRFCGGAQAKAGAGRRRRRPRRGRARPRQQGRRAKGQTAQARPAGQTSQASRRSSVPALELDALKQPRPSPLDARRDPFRFNVRRPPAPPVFAGRGVIGPPGQAAPPVPVAVDPNAPPPVPPPPPITLKFIGIVQVPDRGLKLAVVSDSKGVYFGREGEVIEGRYRISRIGAESIVVSYVDGTGQRTIPLSGSS